MGDDAPAEQVTISRQSLEEAIGEATSLAILLEEHGLETYGETVRRWIVAPLAAELRMATEAPEGDAGAT